MAVVVQDRLAPVDAILPGPDARPRLRLGAVEDLVHHTHDGLRPVLVGEGQEPSLADAGRPDHRAQVAHEVVRMAHVGRDHLEDVVAQLARVVELEGRDT
ncbi:MAG: hypothetical protein AUH99_04915 [Candidatus Rokubacteria bacterium 13_2_20CM_2_70_11]|nr:MAG: hypothetical protein AUH99_04915 [Candidatus Rokubacteria bacterium 13_2_20CM_2_70_11]